ncbi:MAG: 16S rRNA processing protein RimM [Tenericutes bacterium HGW-Tenericutes-6]|nr:MAG: 16S rRNA processing protein RimM [Tenericutes bacterium HGW-Tenericutes-6]PKK97076.1 MAG: 16S rRNA processing protein RimM [Tenericutes bacterium HGW-Tenericutes-3]
MNAMYHIGKITNTHGIKGEVKIYNLSDFNRFFVGAKIYVMLKGKKVEFIIDRVRPQGTILIVKLRSYDDINDVLIYKGLDVYADEIPVEELEDDDYHYDSLLEKAVYTNDHVYIGKVVGLTPVPQGHLLEIQKESGKNILIPFVSAFVEEVLDDKIIINPIEGLL